MQSLHNFLQNKTGRSIELTVTEWNSPSSKWGEAMPIEDKILGNVIKLGNYLAAGVSHSMFWPLRNSGNDFVSLLSFDSLEPTIMYQAFKLMSPLLAGNFANQSSLDKDVYFLQTQSDQNMLAMFVNRGEEVKLVKADLNTSINSNIEIKQLNVIIGKETVSYAKTKESSDTVELNLPSKSITVVKVNTN
jgi:hypothetical protein